MCEEQFEEITQHEGVSSLDSAVVNVSQEIIDDYPASDPRWAEAVPAGWHTCKFRVLNRSRHPGQSPAISPDYKPKYFLLTKEMPKVSILL
jgi:hypothetical protein